MSISIASRVPYLQHEFRISNTRRRETEGRLRLVRIGEMDTSNRFIVHPLALAARLRACAPARLRGLKARRNPVLFTQCSVHCVPNTHDSMHMG